MKPEEVEVRQIDGDIVRLPKKKMKTKGTV